MIGLSTVAVIASWNPQPFAEQAKAYSEEASLRDYLTAVISAKGLPWFMLSSSGDLCSSLASYSNSSIVVSAVGRNFVCATGPPAGATSALLTLELPAGNLSLEAWQLAKG